MLFQGLMKFEGVFVFILRIPDCYLFVIGDYTFCFLTVSRHCSEQSSFFLTSDFLWTLSKARAADHQRKWYDYLEPHYVIFILRSLCRLWPAEIWGLWYPAGGSYLCVLCKYFPIHIVSVHLSFSLKAPDFSFQDMFPMTQTSNFISLGLRFLTREIGMLVVTTSQGCFEDNWVNICKGLRAVVHSKG